MRIAEESAVIVWEGATRTEHFVRRATFATTAADFGFLVPTPSKPELAEVVKAVNTLRGQQQRPATLEMIPCAIS